MSFVLGGKFVPIDASRLDSENTTGKKKVCLCQRSAEWMDPVTALSFSPYYVFLSVSYHSVGLGAWMACNCLSAPQSGPAPGDARRIFVPAQPGTALDIVLTPLRDQRRSDSHNTSPLIIQP